MKLSHSKLSLILNDPASYYLSYIEGISKKETKPALAIGSAVHWGLEHNTEDLTEYFKENSNFKTRDSYTKDQLLAEAMVHGYLKHKDEIFEKILKDPLTGEKLNLVEESHELYVTGKVKSFLEDVDYHDFVGIIDLLLLTNKGFVIIDYKTSTLEPDWNTYLDQIYRYIMLLETYFSEIPVVKVGIINIRKTSIRQKKNENQDEFLNRLKFEYDVNDENYVVYHEFPRETIDSNLLKKYIFNLSKMCDVAHKIDKEKMFYINYGAQMGQYGKSDFFDIIYKTSDAYLLYKINDKIWNEENQTFDTSRDCVELDMKVLDYDNCLNHFSIFEKEADEFFKNNKGSTSDLIDYLNDKYIIDLSLIKDYIITYTKSKKNLKNL